MANKTKTNSKCVVCESKVSSSKDGWKFETFSICNYCKDRILKVGTIE